MGGLNLGIDFTGGSILTIDMGQDYDTQVVNDALQANGIDPSTAQIVRSENQAVIRMQELPADTDDAQFREDLLNTLKETYPNVISGEIESVGGVTSGEIVTNAFLSVIIASVLMLLYIWIRFTLYSGIAAVVALIHDVLIMTAVMSIARIPVNSPYIAACLTIVGYSINDTIVVFDRIRENTKKISIKTMTHFEIADLSIRETLPRTINTSLTTLITILAVYIFGVVSIKEFALPIIVGLISGTYSSIFIASPIWMKLQETKHKRHIEQLSQKKSAKAKAKA
jgi:preprotein translocase subunit SecF